MWCGWATVSAVQNIRAQNAVALKISAANASARPKHERGYKKDGTGLERGLHRQPVWLGILAPGEPQDHQGHRNGSKKY